MTYTPAEQALIDRYHVLVCELMAAYRQADDGGLTSAEECRVADLEHDQDTLYPQLPEALRKEWES